MSTTFILILGVAFVFIMTTLGSAVVFLFKKNISDKVNSLFLGFASGIMVAASVWSLIIPGVEQAENFGKLNFLPVSVGIVFGCLFLIFMDKIVPKLIKKKEQNELSKPSRLFLAITIHNIPEGLAVGLAFGNAIALSQTSLFYSALWLAIGIGVQNFPEGAAVSLPMKQQLNSKTKAFLYGAFSGVVEPIMAVIGILLCSLLVNFMPWLLGFAAGAMLFVVAEELMPDAKNLYPSKISAWGFIFGFVLMMILDVVM